MVKHCVFCAKVWRPLRFRIEVVYLSLLKWLLELTVARSTPRGTDTGSFNDVAPVESEQSVADYLHSHEDQANTENREETDFKMGGLASRRFHCFTWLNVVHHTSKLTGEQDHQGEESRRSNDQNQGSPINEAIKADLDEIHDFLAHKTSLTERLSYQDCPLQTRRNIHRALTIETTEISAKSSKDQNQRKDFERKVDFANSADLWFQFYLPSELDGTSLAVKK